ncbi:hypothetical protein [Sphingomonas sp.]|uniref:hypothetical protein n=1 Tax=Sphingomonas sp. TaxID=28214 RepID=UPI002DD6A965|nr:hypothetical protein [Sphingomonas sp.]
MMKPVALLCVAAALAGCATPRAAADPQDAFFTNLSRLCGKAFAGRLVTTDPADADMAGKPMTMHVRDCSADTIRVPFHVGDDRSRTWVVTRTAAGLRLKHDHRHADGSSDVLTMYGGDTDAPGTATAQAFPVDAESIALFRRENRAVSTTNVWIVEVTPDRFDYALTRKDRHFRVSFDLTRPAPAPPPPWGAR